LTGLSTSFRDVFDAGESIEMHKWMQTLCFLLPVEYVELNGQLIVMSNGEPYCRYYQHGQLLKIEAVDIMPIDPIWSYQAYWKLGPE
jgi:hypothetical protein